MDFVDLCVSIYGSVPLFRGEYLAKLIGVCSVSSRKSEAEPNFDTQKSMQYRLILFLLIWNMNTKMRYSNSSQSRVIAPIDKVGFDLGSQSVTRAKLSWKWQKKVRRDQPESDGDWRNSAGGDFWSKHWLHHAWSHNVELIWQKSWYQNRNLE